MSRHRRSRHGRRGHQSLVFAVVVLVLAAVGGAFVWQRSTSPGPTQPVAAEGARPFGATVTGVIIDASGSNGGAASARKVLATVAASVVGWAGPKPAPYTASSPTPSLHLVLRAVATNSYASTSQLGEVDIPGVSGLSARPADSSNVKAMSEWAQASKRVQTEWAAAESAARSAGSRIRGIAPPGTDSEIAGSLSSMSEVLPAGSPRTVIIVSDLEQAGGPQQIAGSLAATNVIAFQRCDAGATRCTAAATSFHAVAKRLGAATTSVVRLEALPSELSAALHGNTV